MDEGEILEVVWYPIINLPNLHHQTRMLRSIHNRMDHVAEKIRYNKVNYLFVDEDHETQQNEDQDKTV